MAHRERNEGESGGQDRREAPAPRRHPEPGPEQGPDRTGYLGHAERLRQVFGEPRGRAGRPVAPPTGGRTSGKARGPIRAFRAGEREAEVVRRMEGLAAALDGRPGELRRALRQARRAARAGAADYDPVRHAALSRLAAARRDG